MREDDTDWETESLRHHKGGIICVCKYLSNVREGKMFESEFAAASSCFCIKTPPEHIKTILIVLWPLTSRMIHELAAAG